MLVVQPGPLGQACHHSQRLSTSSVQLPSEAVALFPCVLGRLKNGGNSAKIKRGRREGDGNKSTHDNLRQTSPDLFTPKREVTFGDRELTWMTPLDINGFATCQETTQRSQKTTTDMASGPIACPASGDHLVGPSLQTRVLSASRLSCPGHWTKMWQDSPGGQTMHAASGPLWPTCGMLY